MSPATGAGSLDFAPALQRLQRAAPSPLPGRVLQLLLALIAAVLIWAALGQIDIVAVAPGRLVPAAYVQVVQPAEGGIVQDILVGEGDRVRRGQVLARLDAAQHEAQSSQLLTDLQLTRLNLARLRAEESGTEPHATPTEAPELFARMLAELRARRRSLEDAQAGERAALSRAEQELRSAQEMESKLSQTLPIMQEQERAWTQLQKEGFAGRLLAEERRRQRIEAEQDLKAQRHAIAAQRATIEQSRARLAQIESTFRSQVNSERVEAEGQLRRLEQEWRKQSHRNALLELKAPQDGVIKDLATHTQGAVLAPGTVLMTLVPSGGALQAEVWVDNTDSGHVRAGQRVQIKIAAFPFQRHGMVPGVVRHVSADASDAPPAAGGQQTMQRYRALVSLEARNAVTAALVKQLSPGMQVNAEIALGTRTVLDYVLSPVRAIVHEAGRER